MNTNWRRWRTPAIGVALTALIAAPLLIERTSQADAAELRLERFGSCEDFTDAVRASITAASDRLGGGGAGGTAPMATREQAADAAAPGAAAQSFSTTNVQQAGIDEPDIVKSDGQRVFALANNKVYALDVSGERPRIAGSLTLPAEMGARDMLLAGNRLLVIADGGGGVAPAVDVPAGAPAPEYWRGGGGGTVLFDVDVSDLAAPRIAKTVRLDASYVSARQSGGTVRLVMSSEPLAKAMAANPAAGGDVIRPARLRASDLIPSYTVVDANGTSATSRPLVGCRDISRATEKTELGMVTIVTLDLGRGVEPVDTDAVMARANTVMASADHVYVAVDRAQETADSWSQVTDIHVFDASQAGTTSYSASGTVGGSLLNQFSMSEFEGRLRVATTSFTTPKVSTPTAASGVVAPDVVVDGRPNSESAVTVLERQGDRMGQIGRVGGLGKGEQIYAVRFVGSVGYVVTFRQTDPLYTVDLANPAAPKVVGELKIPGYSAYLHPVDATTLIGVGQNATDQGQRTGLQVGLFDVSNPASPRRTATWTMPNTGSESEYDHHAFLWWPQTRSLVLPVSSQMVAFDEMGGGRTVPPAPTAVALRVTPEGIARTGVIRHPQSSDYVQIRRSLVVGDDLLTMSDAGVAVTSVDGVEQRNWIPFTR